MKRLILIMYFLILSDTYLAFAQSDATCPPYFFQVDDREIGISKKEEVERLRNNLNSSIWGKDGFPKTISISKWDSTSWAVASQSGDKNLSDYRGNRNLQRVDKIEITLTARPEIEGCRTCYCTPWFNPTMTAYHFIPKQSKGEGVIINHGHWNYIETFPHQHPYNFYPLIDSLINRNYNVMFVFMPQHNPSDIGRCEGPTGMGNCHSCLLQSKLASKPSRDLSILQVHLEPAASAIAFLSNEYHCKNFHMIGISGGGWTTTLYSCLDTRIKKSFAIASGLWPLYLVSSSPGDYDYGDPLIYMNVKVQQMYTLASVGNDRMHVQVFIRRDGSNGEQQYYSKTFLNPYKPDISYDSAIRQLENRVKKTIKKIGNGSFELFIDESTSFHQISDETRKNKILDYLTK